MINLIISIMLLCLTDVEESIMCSVELKAAGKCPRPSSNSLVVFIVYILHMILLLYKMHSKAMMSCWHLSGRSHQNFAMIFKNKNLEQWVYQLTKSFNILGRPKNGATLFYSL